MPPSGRGTGEPIQRLPRAIYSLEPRPLPARPCARQGRRMSEGSRPQGGARQEPRRQAVGTQCDECCNRSYGRRNTRPNDERNSSRSTLRRGEEGSVRAKGRAWSNGSAGAGGGGSPAAGAAEQRSEGLQGADGSRAVVKVRGGQLGRDLSFSRRSLGFLQEPVEGAFQQK